MANTTGKVIAAFLAGAAAGASLGILLAPEKGEATRQKLRDSFDEFGDRANEQYMKYKKTMKKEPKEVQEEE